MVSYILKPVSLCLIQMGCNGLELVKAFPTVLAKDEMDIIIFQSIPFGANDGDFATRTISKRVICGYVFSVHKNGNERSNIATLTAVFDSLDFQPKFIKKVFSFIIQELKDNKLLSINLVKEILPKIYDGLVNKTFKIKLSSDKTLEFDILQNEETTKKAFQDFSEDVW